MTVTSQNGWSANDRSVIASYSLPGGRVALRAGDVSVLLLWCANEWHRTVEPLVWPGVWGYAERLIRGSSTTLSNHASGTAIDLNAPKHPLGVAPSKTFTATQIATIRRIVAATGGAVAWGGEWSRPDGMHFEVNTGAAGVKAAADRIRQAPPPQPAPAPRRRMEDDDMYLKCESTKGGPIWTGLLSGGVLVGPLTPGELGSVELNVNKYGALVQWAERSTWDRLATRS